MTDLAQYKGLNKQVKAKRLLPVLLCLLFTSCLFPSITHAKDIVSPVALTHSYAGNNSFELAVGTFLSGTVDNCSVSTTASGQLTGGIPQSATILAAHLYWAGSYKPNGQGKLDPDTTVTLNGISVTSSVNYQVKGNIGADFYSGKADVTNIVIDTLSSGSEIYTLTDMDIFDDSGNCSDTTLGGWALIVVFEEDSLPFQVTNIFDGFMEVFNNSGIIDLSLDNFIVAPNPSGKHAHITFEGDAARSGTKETLKFENNILGDAYNQSDNQFNSQSNINVGTPYSTNTLGVDVDSYDVSAFLQAGNTGFTTSYSSGSDTVLLAAEVISLTNVPVADLAVTSTPANSWQAGSNVTQKFAITNHGPNDLSVGRTNFSTTLPSGLTFDGTQTETDWTCTQSGQQLDCSYQQKLRSGWTTYLDLKLITANTPGSSVDLAVSVDHDNGTNDILDNDLTNNTIQFSVPLTVDAIIDLSASSKRPVNVSGDSLLAGQTLQYIITLDDANDLPVNNLSVIDNLPLNINEYRITSTLPAGSSDNSTYISNGDAQNQLNISGITLAAGATLDIELEVDIATNAPKGASLQNLATLTYGSGNPQWIVDTGDITVVEYDLSASSKQAIDLNGDVVLPDDTIRYVMTLKDADGLEISNLNVTDDLPNNISNFNIISMPAGAIDNSIIGGGSNGTGFIDINNINIPLDQEAQIIIDVTIDSSAPAGSSLMNTADLQLNSSQWAIISNDIIVNEEVDVSTSGNKPLYLADNTLGRLLPTINSQVSIPSNTLSTWTLSPVLQDELILNTGTIPLNLVIEGNQTNTNSGGSISFEFYYFDTQKHIISSSSLATARYDDASFYNKSLNFDISSSVSIPQGATLHLDIINDNPNFSIDIHRFQNTFYSALILDAATVINVDKISVWDKPYSDVSSVNISEIEPDNNFYIQAEVSDPFGAFDITKAEIQLSKGNGEAYDFSDLATYPNGNLMTWVNTSINPQASNIKIFEIPVTVLETETNTGFWNFTIKAYEGTESGSKQVTHERAASFWVKPFVPNIALSKTVQVINDPINGSLTDGNKPKAIPGSEIHYSIRTINTGKGLTDNGSLILQEEVPANAELFIGDLTCTARGPGTGLGPLCFSDGTNPNESGLSFNFDTLANVNDKSSGGDDIQFSIDGTDFTYQPIDAGDSYDSAIRFIRILPNGEFNNQPSASSVQPEFTFRYQVRLN